MADLQRCNPRREVSSRKICRWKRTKTGLGSERDIDNVSPVRIAEGTGDEPLELLRNGNFENGLDHWGVSMISPAEAEITASENSPISCTASFYANIAKEGFSAIRETVMNRAGKAEDRKFDGKEAVTKCVLKGLI